jgi:hypothetical protein
MALAASSGSRISSDSQCHRQRAHHVDRRASCEAWPRLRSSCGMTMTAISMSNGRVARKHPARRRASDHSESRAHFLPRRAHESVQSRLRMVDLKSQRIRPVVKAHERERNCHHGRRRTSYHFPTKEALAAAVLRRYTEDVAKIIERSFDQEADPVVVWTRAFRGTLYKDRICPCAVLGASSRDLPREVAKESGPFQPLGRER